jgi:hypothetical protein
MSFGLTPNNKYSDKSGKEILEKMLFTNPVNPLNLYFCGFESLKCFALSFNGDGYKEDRKVVVEYVAKLVITSNPSGNMGERYKDFFDGPIEGYKKATETKEDLLKEAEMQNTVYRYTSTQNYKECPAIASFNEYNNADGKAFIGKLRYLFNNNVVDPTEKQRGIDICDYLINRLNGIPTREFAIILMNKVGSGEAYGGTTTMRKFIKIKDGDLFNGIWTINKTQKNFAYCCIISAILRLFLVGIIHYDLHLGNIMIYYDERGRIQCRILDFGNSGIFTSTKPNEFLTFWQKRILTKVLEETERDFKSNVDIKKEQKIILVRKIMDALEHSEREGNAMVFKNYLEDDSNKCQMMWWIKLQKDGDIDSILENAYDITKRAEEQNRNNPPRRDITNAGFIVNSIKVTASSLLVGLFACGVKYYAAKNGYFGGADETPENIEKFIEDKDLTDILQNMVGNKVCPINIEEEQKQSLQTLIGMLKQVPPDSNIELPQPPDDLNLEIPVPDQNQDAGRGKRRRSRKTKKTRRIRKTRRTKKQRKTKRF